MNQEIFFNNGGSKVVDVEDCPFCGAQPEIHHIGNNYTKGQKIKFRCPQCRIERTNATLRYPIEWCLDKSVEQWNMRSPAPEPRKAD